jgi:hypothetical protein
VTTRALFVAAAALALQAAPASAAQRPTAATQPPTSLTPTSATLHGAVNPHGQSTTWSFEYGPSASYGSSTPVSSTGAGTKKLNVRAPISSLTPRTTYHFRIVATNASGTTTSPDATFTTTAGQAQVIVRARPSAVRYGTGVFVEGRLVGSDVAGRKVTLLSRTFPFDAMLQPLGSKFTGADGTFGFGVPLVVSTTRYRVDVVDGVKSSSPVITVPVSLRVSTSVTARRVHHGSRVRFTGNVTPAMDGARFALQRRRSGRFTTVAGGVLQAGTAGHSTYTIHMRVGRTGSWRIFVQSKSPGLDSGVGRTVRIEAV